ncbi:MAG TPA: MFS transporter [Vicinamibacteria bacterium]|nr:MFS transporter [Vicinamibacteria bacterium]
MRAILRIYREAFSGLTEDLWLLALVTLVNRSGTMVLPFISLYLTTERGLAADEAGRLIALYGVGAAIGGYSGGWLSDRIGHIRTQQTSLALGGICFLVLSTLEQRDALAAAIFVTGAIVESFRPAVMASFAARADPSILAKAFAFLRLAANLGMGIGPAIGGFLSLYNYRWLFYADAGTCWLAAVLLLRLTNEKSSHTQESHETTGGSPLRDLPYLALLGLVILMAAVLFQIFSTFPLYLNERAGFREDAIGYLLSFNALLIVVFEMILIQAVSDREGMQLVGAGAFLLCAGFGLMPFGATLWWLALTVAIWTLGEMLALPMLNVVVAQRAAAGYRGQYMGLYTTAFSLAFILAPFGGTLIYEHFGPDKLWYVVGVLGFALWPLSAALGRHLRLPTSS